MKIVDVDDVKYIVHGVVPADIDESYGVLKDRYGADVILRRGKELYLCERIVEAVFEDVK